MWGSLDAIKHFSKGLETGLSVRGGELDMDWKSRKGAEAKIVGMAFAPAPKADLRLGRCAELPCRRLNRRSFQYAPLRNAAGHKKSFYRPLPGRCAPFQFGGQDQLPGHLAIL